MEDIMSPAFEGRMVIVDNALSLISSMPIQGNEKVTVEVEDTFDQTYTYTYRVWTVANRQNADRKQVYTLGLISEEGLLNERMKVAQAIEGDNITSVVGKLVQDNFDVEITEGSFEETQNGCKLIPRRQSPFSVIRTLQTQAIPRKKKQTAGFVFFQTREGFNFRSFDGLVADYPKIPKNEWFYYSMGKRDEESANLIQEISYIDEIDMMKKLREGSYSSLSNEISIIANPPELGMWWYEYGNGWTGTLSNGYMRHDQGFVDTTLTCGDYFGNILVRSFVVDVAGAPLNALPYIDINTLQVQDYYKGAQNFTVTNNQTQDVTVSYTIDAGQFTWKLRIINEFPYMETTDGGTRTIFTLNNATHANGPTVVNTGDFSTYTGQLATATGLLRECPFRGDTSINLPVDFSVKNDIQPAIFPARGTQKLYTLWVELVESPFSLTDLIHLTAVADPCHDQTYDFAYTQNGACITPSNDYFCNFVKPLKDRNHAEQPITGMEGVAQVQVTDGITPRVLDFQIPAPWPVLFSYLGDCNPTCA